jgi:hypothetical protein
MTVVMELKPTEGMVSKNQSLQEQFKSLQSRMVALGMALGLNHPAVIEISQKLDKVHNKIQKAGR